MAVVSPTCLSCALAAHDHQAIIGNLFQKVDRNPKEIATAFGLNSRCTTCGIVAKITGLSRQCVFRQITQMKQRDFRAKRPTNSGGRKRKYPDLPEELPDLSNYCSAAADSEAMDLEEVLFAGRDNPGERLPEQCDELPLHQSIIPGFLGNANRDTLVQHWAAAQQVPCPYQGLGSVDPDCRDLVVGLRLASIAIRLVVGGGSLEDFGSWIHLLDTFFPGEMGELHHSRRFAEDISASALHVVQVHTAYATYGVNADSCRVAEH